ncbi:MAG TPA: tetratricopeptide repeat protein [Phenylobacterium sp.]|jgi:tetratricopeptide (TPR) repeat protein|nr:tetratricopeptide repeat protein [Phenylobacterium sp.]
MSSPPRISNAPDAIDQALEAASLAFRMSRPDEAERLAAQVLKADRGNITAARFLGTALLMQNRADEALAALRPAARRSGDPIVETLLAKAFSVLGQAEEALVQLRRATGRRPAYPHAFVELGDQLGAAGRFEEAIAAFEAGLALAPDALVLRVGLGYLHLQRDDHARARALFQQILAAAPNRHDAKVGLARAMVRQGDYAEAAELFESALRLRPHDAATRLELGKCLLELGQRQAGEAALRAAHTPGPAILALTGSPHGRLFLRPSMAAKFLGEPAG